MPRPDTLSTLQKNLQPFFAPTPAPVFGTAHGCLDLLGALEAEGGGTLAQMVLPRQISVALQPRADNILRIKSMQIPEPDAVEIPFSGEEMPKNSAWVGGIRAIFHLLAAPGRPPQGANLLIHGDIPQGAGQASSTALLAATARALLERDHQPMETEALAQIIATAEAQAIAGPRSVAPMPSRGHIIDAMTCLHGYQRPPQLLRYSAQPHRFVGAVPMPPEVRVFALDTGVRFTAARDTLAELRIAAAMGLRIIETIYRDLGQPHTPLHGHLTNTSPLLYRQYFRTLLPRRMRGNDFLRTYGELAPSAGAGVEGPPPVPLEELDTPRLFRVRTAVDHLIAENEHAEQFLQAMEELADGATGEADRIDPAERQRTLQRAGRLLLASHHSYRLRLELSCREADALVDSLMESGPDKGIYGARITGVGGGGTVVALLDHSPAATDALLNSIHNYHEQTGRTLGVTEA